MKYHPLLKEFWGIINSETKSDYCTINNCGIAAKDLLDWLENEKNIGFAERIRAGVVRKGKEYDGGFIKLDNSKLIPHSWVEFRGEILDPSGFTPEGDGQFDKLIQTKDPMERKSRYKILNSKGEIINESVNICEKTYSSYKLSVESAEKLSQWIKDSEIIEPIAQEDLHITITNSEETVDIIPSEKTIILKKEDFVIGSLGRALVLFVESEELEKIHASAIEAGADSKYDKFIPHISLSYNLEANENTYPLLFSPEFDITLSHEEVKHDIEEDTPANSTANIPVVPMPMKTFKMFRRKINDK